jgi:hypothetical protein
MKYLTLVLLINIGIASVATASGLQPSASKLKTDSPIANLNKVHEFDLLVKKQGNPELSYRQLFFKLLHHRCPLH